MLIGRWMCSVLCVPVTLLMWGCEALESPALADHGRQSLVEQLHGPGQPPEPPPLIAPEHFAVPLPVERRPAPPMKRDDGSSSYALQWTRVALYTLPKETPRPMEIKHDPAGLCGLGRELGHEVLPRRGLRLVAVVHDADRGQPPRAMLEDSSGVGHLVEPGQQLGPMLVADIGERQVILVFAYRGTIERVILPLGAILCNV
ncbi:MAG: hypothetical protein AAFS10_07240 [Myxococcota bacterium]